MKEARRMVMEREDKRRKGVRGRGKKEKRGGVWGEREA